MSAGKSDLKNTQGFPQTSKDRRDQENKGINEAKVYFPLSQKERDNLSKLQSLHYASIFVKWNVEKSKLNSDSSPLCNDEFKTFADKYINLSNILNGFIIVMTQTGQLVYVSENVQDFFGLNSLDVLLGSNEIFEVLHSNDEIPLKQILESKEHNENFELYTSWYVSRIKRKIQSNNELRMIKMTGHFMPLNNLFIALCEPMLSCYKDPSVVNWKSVFTSRNNLDLQFEETSQNCEVFLGYQSATLKGCTLYDLIHPEDVETLERRHKFILNRRSSDGFVEAVRLLTNSGVYQPFLLTMQSIGSLIQCIYQLVKPNEVNSYKDYLTSIIQSPLPTVKKVKRSKDLMQSKSDSDLLSETMSPETATVKKARYSYDCSSVMSHMASDQSQCGYESTSIYSPMVAVQPVLTPSSQLSCFQQQNQFTFPQLNFNALNLDSKPNESYDNPFFDSASSDELLNSDDCILCDFLQEDILF